MTIDELKGQVTASVEEFLTGTAKDVLIKALKETILPALRETAQPFTDKLKADAVTEQGWNKFRDGVFLPAVISVAFWGAEKMLDHMTDQPDAVQPTA